MKDSDILFALSCCIEADMTHNHDVCTSKCPYKGECNGSFDQALFDLLVRQKNEIEVLKSKLFEDEADEDETELPPATEKTVIITAEATNVVETDIETDVIRDFYERFVRDALTKQNIGTDDLHVTVQVFEGGEVE
jgi:hypothetical protein